MCLRITYHCVNGACTRSFRLSEASVCTVEYFPCLQFTMPKNDTTWINYSTFGTFSSDILVLKYNGMSWALGKYSTVRVLSKASVGEVKGSQWSSQQQQLPRIFLPGPLYFQRPTTSLRLAFARSKNPATALKAEKQICTKGLFFKRKGTKSYLESYWPLISDGKKAAERLFLWPSFCTAFVDVTSRLWHTWVCYIEENAHG